MAQKVLVALDQGTTSSRAVVFDTAGHMLAAKGVEFPQHYPKPGWVEHDPNDILTTQITALREAVKLSGVDVADIAAIGITNQRGDHPALGSGNRCLRSQCHCVAMPPHCPQRGMAAEGRLWGYDPPEDGIDSRCLFLRH